MNVAKMYNIRWEFSRSWVYFVYASWPNYDWGWRKYWTL